MSNSIFSYKAPSNVFSSLRSKPNYILEPQDLSGVTAAFKTKAINRLDHDFFDYGRVLMQLTVEIDNNAALTDADYIELAVQSGVEVDVNSKIVGGTTVPNISYEHDDYPGKRISSTVTLEKYLKTNDEVHSMTGKLKITKNSFAYQKDGTYYVTKHIAFPTVNTSVTNPASANTLLDDFYGAVITPFGSMANNANVKISVAVFESLFDTNSMAAATLKAKNLRYSI